MLKVNCAPTEHAWPQGVREIVKLGIGQRVRCNGPSESCHSSTAPRAQSSGSGARYLLVLESVRTVNYNLLRTNKKTKRQLSDHLQARFVEVHLLDVSSSGMYSFLRISTRFPGHSEQNFVRFQFICVHLLTARVSSQRASLCNVCCTNVARAWVQQRAGAPFSYPTNMIVVPCCALLLTEESGVVGT